VPTADAYSRVQLPGRAAGGGGLRCSLLHLAQLGDRLGKCGEAGDQRHLSEHGIMADERGGRQQPGSPAQAAPRRAAARDPRVRNAGGASVRVRCLADHPAPESSGCGVQGVGRGPGGIAGGSRAGGGAATDLIAGILRGAGSVFPDRVPFGSGEPAGSVRRCRRGFPAAS